MLNANLLRGAIAGAGLTQGEVAERIGISANTLSNKINGKSNFDTVEVEKLCALLSIKDPEARIKIFLNGPP